MVLVIFSKVIWVTGRQDLTYRLAVEALINHKQAFLSSGKTDRGGKTPHFVEKEIISQRPFIKVSQLG
jgi:hypothetical protein